MHHSANTVFFIHGGLDDAFYQPELKEYTTLDQDGYTFEAVEFKSESGVVTL